MLGYQHCHCTGQCQSNAYRGVQFAGLRRSHAQPHLGRRHCLCLERPGSLHIFCTKPGYYFRFCCQFGRVHSYSYYQRLYGHQYDQCERCGIAYRGGKQQYALRGRHLIADR